MIDHDMTMGTTSATARPTGPDGMPPLHALTVSMCRAYRRRDLAALIEHGRGLVVGPTAAESDKTAIARAASFIAGRP